MPLYGGKTVEKQEFKDFGEGTPYSKSMRRPEGPMPRRRSKMKRKTNTPTEYPMGNKDSRASRF